MNQTAGNTINSPEQLRALIREEVAAVLQEFVRDPDFGLELRDEMVARIKQSEAQIASGDTVPWAEVKNKLS